MAAPGFSALSPTSHSLFFFFFLFLILLLPHFHRCDGRSITTTDWSSYRRSLLASARRSSTANQISACNDLREQSQCNRNPNCRWCRSDAVDDMCFHKTEAWRLPSEVFTCDQNLSSSRSAS